MRTLRGMFVAVNRPGGITNDPPGAPVLFRFTEATSNVGSVRAGWEAWADASAAANGMASSVYRTSVLTWSLDLVYHEHLDGKPSRLELQPELLLQCREERSELAGLPAIDSWLSGIPLQMDLPLALQLGLFNDFGAQIRFERSSQALHVLTALSVQPGASPTTAWWNAGHR